MGLLYMQIERHCINVLVVERQVRKVDNRSTNGENDRRIKFQIQSEWKHQKLRITNLSSHKIIVTVLCIIAVVHSVTCSFVFRIPMTLKTVVKSTQVGR